MKIYICIPSFNEAKTIELVTKIVDQGLQSLVVRYKKTLDAKIINIDSNSEDNTVNLFKNVNTIFPKQSIVLEKPRGKGKNLLAFIEIARREKASCCLTLDADIHSANALWIPKLLNPILDNQADFVTPLYERSRFEGSSTNHFAYPVILATTGVNVRQPIAGDFAFNPLLFDIIQRAKIPDAASHYGIDIFLTLEALSSGLRHQQVKLGKKMHNPSFDKLEYMFPQIAASALFVLRKTKIKAIKLSKCITEINNISSRASFSHKDVAKTMREHALFQLKSVDIGKWGWVPIKIIKRVSKIDDMDVQIEDWVSILSSWIEYGLNNKNIDVSILAEQLLPFFVLRATTFWFSSENMTAEGVESQIRKQALALHFLIGKM